MSLWTSNDTAQAQPSRYVDRDDIQSVERGQDKRQNRDYARRRSISPVLQRGGPSIDRAARRDETLSDHRLPIAWKDLRTPRSDQTDREQSKTALQASMNASTPSKPISTAPNKRFAHDISRWNRKQSELHATSSLVSAETSVSGGADPSADPKTISRTTPATAVGASLDAARLPHAQLIGYDYKDLGRIACLLCQRKFKSVDTLHRHETESQLHKDNLANAETCRQAVERKLQASAEASSRSDDHRISSPSSDPPQTQQPAPAHVYRDRASERRAVFGADAPAKQSDFSNRNKVFAGPEATTLASNIVEAMPQSAPEQPIDSGNIGSKLLAMMGWSQGQGLGVKSQGRTEIVETKIYKPGAGLGSIAPTDTAARDVGAHARTSNVTFTGYVDRAKDRARQQLAAHSQQHPE